MAVGLSGSNGGIGRVYRAVLVADVEAGITKYETLRSQIPEENREVRTMYSGFIESLRELQASMTKDNPRGD
ncbi:MAG: hypothetical protein KJ600_04515 [Nanoarchaeota archaeon]|nr:hypothetical protein [Nanoarchaeota archaeon]MBU1103791.1 hypothetical protein [Nanoarchaeota archaeon]